MHIYLVRHTKYHNPEKIFPFHLPVYLSKDGRAHARRVAEWFADKKLFNLPIFSSPIVRCVQTSEILAAKTQSYVACDSRLIETSSPNIQGAPRPDHEPWRVEESDPDRESRTAVLERMIAIYQEKLSEKTDCILVSHGEPLTLLYYHLLGRDLPNDLWNPANVDQVIDRGEIVDIEIDRDQSMTPRRYKV